jgi:hypothetical protein
MEKAMAGRGLVWADLTTALGPETGMMVEWPEDAAMPTLLVAAEVRDAAKAQAFNQVLIDPVTLGAPWRSEERDGILVATAPPLAIAVVHPTVALTERFALFGLSPEAVTAALARAKAPAGALEQTAAFQEMAAFAPEQAQAFAYLDFQRLFERVYRMARPFITLSLAFSAEAGAQYDAGKLPPVQAVSKHFGASVLTQSQIEGGTVIESIGSVTIPELLLGVGAAMAASGLPDFSSALPGSAPAKSRKLPPVSAPPPADASRAAPAPEKTTP